MMLRLKRNADRPPASKHYAQGTRERSVQHGKVPRNMKRCSGIACTEGIIGYQALVRCNVGDEITRDALLARAIRTSVHDAISAELAGRGRH
jgi:hypothetical protein